MGGPEAFNRRLIAPLVIGALLNPINSSILAVALVPIGRAFGAPASQTAWLVSGLYLVTAVGQPVVGRLIDLQGPRRLFLAGSALVGLGGLIGALAPSLGMLVVARMVLGLGTCAGYPAAMYLIRSEGQRTGQASPREVLTLLAIATQTVVVIGPSLGGALISLGGWRATFAINVPVALLSCWLGYWRLPSRLDAPPLSDGDGPTDPGGATAVPRFDTLGVVLFAGALTVLLLFLMSPSIDRLWLLALAALLAGAFVRCERRAPSPFIEVTLLRNVPLIATYTRQLLIGLTSYSILYGFSQWMQEGRGLSAAQAGLLLLPLSAAGLITSATTGRRPEIRAKLVVGAALQLAGSIALVAITGDAAIWLLVLIVIVFGIPQGLLSLGNSSAIYHQAEPARMAASAGLLRTAMYLGAVGASAAIGGFFAPSAGTSEMHELAWFLVGTSGLLLVLTTFDRGLAAVGLAEAERGPTSAPPARTPQETTA